MTGDEELEGRGLHVPVIVLTAGDPGTMTV